MMVVLILLIVLVIEIFKSIRIEQLKKIEENTIESIGNYEKKSKNDYLKPLSEKSDKNED